MHMEFFRKHWKEVAQNHRRARRLEDIDRDLIAIYTEIDENSFYAQHCRR